MKRRVLTAALFGAATLALTPATASAFGGKLFRHAGGDCCGSAAPAPEACCDTAPGSSYGDASASTYGSMPTGGDCGSVAAAPSYTTQTVTKYRTESKQETYTYTEMVPTTTTEKQQVTTYKQVAKQVPYTYTVNEMVTVSQPRTVTEYKAVTTPETYTYQVCQPTTTMTSRNVVTNVPTTQTVMVPVTRQVAVPAPAVADGCGTPTTGGDCGGCATPAPCAPVCETAAAPKKGCFRGLLGRLCGKNGGSVAPMSYASYAPAYSSSAACGSNYQTVTEMVPQTRTVMTQQVSTVQVPVTTYQYVTQTGTRNVTRMVPETKTVNVNVVQCVPTTKTGTRTEYTSVPETKTVNVNVVKCVPTTKTAMNTVYENVPVTNTVDVQVTKMVSMQKTGTRTVSVNVPYTETVQVPTTSVGGSDCCNGSGGSYAPATTSNYYSAPAATCAPAAKMGLCDRLKGMFSRGKSCGGCN
jgi:hypothetical protein